MANGSLIRFIPNSAKVVEALTWLANKRPGIDIFHVCKVLFLADREHLRRYGRPILGDRYIAMDDGPVPSHAYNVAQRDGHHVDGMTLEIASSAFTYDASGAHPRMFPKREPNEKLFSRTDLTVLAEMTEKFADMSFWDLWNIVHDDAAYKAARSNDGKNQDMSYELLLNPEDPHTRDIIANMRENAQYISM
jgi:uncharacterized phage-associated protein